MTAPIFTSYQNWLRSKSYSDATIRNYLVDLRKYISFSENIFDSNNLTSYFQNINQDPNYKRFLASLSKFFQFALDQKLISENPFEKIRSSTGVLPYAPAIDDLIDQYQQYLTKNSSTNTIRNYINDIHQFINWAQSSSGRDESRPYKNNVGV